MTVEAAKKRYSSMRQKYCREKQKMEVQRRTKSNPFRPWVFHDRLHFLDEYIRPRTTYTNDSGFEDAHANSFPPEDEHETVNSMDDEFEDEDGQSGGGLNGPIVHYNPEDVPDRNSFQFVNDFENSQIQVILSEYSGEVSTYEPPSKQISDHESGSNSQGTSGELMRNWSHLNRGDDFNVAPVVQGTVHLSGSDLQGTSGTSAEEMRNWTRSTRKDDVNGKRNNVPPIKSVPAAAAKSKSGDTNATRGIKKTVEPIAATTSSTSRNEQSLDSVRNKLDSCIASLSTKISEKQERSPHAPFLAYLGTKLPNISKEDLPKLEKGILDLVDSYGQ